MKNQIIDLWCVFHNKTGSIRGACGPTVIDRYFFNEADAQKVYNELSNKHLDCTYGLQKTTGKYIDQTTIFVDPFLEQLEVELICTPNK